MNDVSIRDAISDWRAGDEADSREAPEGLATTASAIAAGVVTRRALSAAWRRIRGRQPPWNPAESEVSWTDALIWAAGLMHGGSPVRRLPWRPW